MNTLKNLISSFLLIITCLSCSKQLDPRIETVKAELNSAVCVTIYGNILDEGGSAVIERGFCWGLNPNPSISDNYVKSDFGLGEFSTQICNLDLVKTYYFRTYAVNAKGTFFGKVMNFNILELMGGGTFVDVRDNHQYHYLPIGTQTWMMENLAYMPAVSSVSTGSDTEKHYYVYGYNGTIVTDAKEEDNYTTYGVLYNWPASMDGASSSTSVPSGVQGICPQGWHLPSDAEWTVLTDFLTNNGYGYDGSGDDIGKSMAALSGWTTFGFAGTIGNDQGSNNLSGFTALPGGFRNYLYGRFYNLGYDAYFWSASENDTPDAWYRILYYDRYGVGRYYSDRSHGFSVRCLKDN